MKISSDSQYALVNHAPDVGFTPDIILVGPDECACESGDPLVGPTHGASRP